MSISQQLPILIAGAGIVGLALAQALKKEGIPFRIYERDEDLQARFVGRGISVHWTHSGLENCLPSGMSKELPSVQVDSQQGLKSAYASLPAIPFQHLGSH